MRYVGTDQKLVELMWDEQVAKEAFDDLLDIGLTIPDAVNRVRANDAFSHLSDMFWRWLAN